MSGSSCRLNIINWDLNSLLSICHSGTAVSVFTAKLFIYCVLIEYLTSGHVILVLYWLHVCGPNVIWKKKYCLCSSSVGLYCIEARSRIKIILECKKLKRKFTNLNLSYALQHGHKRAGTEMKGKTISLKGGSVAPVLNRDGVGVFSMKMKGLSWPPNLNISSFLWDTSKKPFWRRWY